MKFAGVYELTLWFGVWCAMCAYGVAAQSPATWVFGLLAIGTTRLITGPTIGGKPAARRVISILIPGVVFLTLLRSLGTGFSVELFSEFVVMLLAVKTLDRRRSRDAAQIMTLSVFLTIGAVLTSTTMFTGVWVLVFVPVLVVWVLSYQVVRAREAAEEGEGGEPDKRTARDARRLVVASLLFSGVLASIIFVILPRDIAGRAFGTLAQANGTAVTGFSDTVELGSAGIISESATPVLDLKLRDRAGRVINGAGQTLYLRGAVLDQYTGTAWQASQPRSSNGFKGDSYSPGRPVDIFSSQGERYPSRPWRIEQHITLRNAPRERSPIFAAWEPVEVIFAQATDATIPPNDEGVMTRTSPQGQFSYTVRSTGPVTAPPPEPGTERPRRVTFRSERVAALAAEVLEDAEINPDPAQREFAEDAGAARAIERYLRANYVYSLEPGRPRGGRDPIEWFLFDPESGRGHCEYFASSMVAMCRSVGIDARVITGYVAADYNDLSQTYLVRQSNAHAWTEVLVAPNTWRTFDPTPPAEFRRLHQRPTSLLTTIERAIESLEYAWVTNVVGYNASSRESLLGPFADPPWVQALERRADRRLDGRSGRKAVIAAITAGTAVFIAIIGFGLVLGEMNLRPFAAVLAWLRLAPRRDHAHANEPAWLIRAHARVLQRLAKSGHPKPLGTPLLAHAEHLADDELRDEARRVGRLVYRARFSERPVEDADRSGLV